MCDENDVDSDTFFYLYRVSICLSLQKNKNGGNYVKHMMFIILYICHYAAGDDNSTVLGFRIEHQRMHERHRGHEAMHAEMVLILIVTLVVAQIVLVQWKQRHFGSYQVRHVH